MTVEEKIAMLEEVMELDEGTLKADDELEEYEEWDSIARLAFIAMLDSDFDKVVKGDVIKALKTVQDALDLME